MKRILTLCITVAGLLHGQPALTNTDLEGLTATAKDNLESLGVYTNDEPPPAPDNAIINAVIAVDPEATRSTLGVKRPNVVAQSWAAKRMSEWTFGGGSPSARPLLVAVVGDSYATNIALPDHCAVNGSWDLGLSAVSGGAAEVQQDWTTWINGRYMNFPVGSQADLTLGGQTGDGGYCEGDKCAIAYIKEPGGGTFEFQYYSSVAAAWTTLATIDCSNGSKIGAYSEYSLPATNEPHFKLRVKSVTTGPVKVLFAGVWDSLAGGGMRWSHGSLSGQSPTQLNSTPAAVFNPIWQGIKPDLVVGCFQDGATEFAAGGGWRLFYAKAQALWPSDWMLLSANPCNEAGTPSIYYPTYDAPAFQATISAQIDWAITENQTWVDNYSVFGSYAQAVADGNMLISDVAHLTPQGQLVRHVNMWQSVPFASLPLGGAMPYTFSPQGQQPGGNSVLRMHSRGAVLSRPLVVKSTGSYALVLDDQTNRFSFAKSWGITSKDGTLGFHYADPNASHFDVAGWGVRMKYGASHRVRKVTAGTSCNQLDYTVLVDATSAPATVTLDATPSTYNGIVHVIKKTDASANAVTIDPAGAATIDGSATKGLTNQWDYIVVQSEGANWVKIGGNM